MMRLLSLPESINHGERLTKIESSLEKLSEIRILLATQPKIARLGRKTPELLEVKLGGATPREQFEYARNQLGKEVKISDTFKEGDWLDVIGVTKGKGIQGPVKRFGIRRKFHKARKTVRQVGSYWRMDSPLCHVFSSTCGPDGFPSEDRVQQASGQDRARGQGRDAKGRIHQIRRNQSRIRHAKRHCPWPGKESDNSPTWSQRHRCASTHVRLSKSRIRSGALSLDTSFQEHRSLRYQRQTP